ncbi:MAG: hypothetical protein Q9M30_03550 [Mariprofundaceae bacterium]|nr:hypothetical protein [Mariprofundaceae bacterium]
MNMFVINQLNLPNINSGQINRKTRAFPILTLYINDALMILNRPMQMICS